MSPTRKNHTKSINIELFVCNDIYIKIYSFSVSGRNFQLYKRTFINAANYFQTTHGYDQVWLASSLNKTIDSSNLKKGRDVDWK